jgi:hypothetical protein
MASTKMMAVLVLCLALTGAMAQTPAQQLAIVQACGMKSAVAINAVGAKCYKAIRVAKTKCPTHCVKVATALKKSTNVVACITALSSLGVSSKLQAKMYNVSAAPRTLSAVLLAAVLTLCPPTPAPQFCLAGSMGK